MDRDTHADYLKRRDTFGTADNFIARAGEVWRAAEDKCGLLEPLSVVLACYEAQRPRDTFAEVVTPDVARALGDAAARGKLHGGFLLVSAFMPAEQFAQARRQALAVARVEQPPKKPTAFDRGQWGDLLFLYLHQLDGKTPVDLAAEFLFDGKHHEFGQVESQRRRLTQKARDGIDRARKLIEGQTSTAD